jgi:hypothetical protein
MVALRAGAHPGTAAPLPVPARSWPARRSGWSREHRQPRGRDTDQVAVDLATTQPQEPDHLLQPDRVAVPNGEQPRRGDPLEVGIGPAGAPTSSCPSLSRSSCSLSGSGDLARSSWSIGVPAMASTVTAAIASPRTGRSPSGWNDTDDTTSLPTSAGRLMARWRATAPPTLNPTTSARLMSSCRSRPTTGGRSPGQSQSAVRSRWQPRPQSSPRPDTDQARSRPPDVRPRPARRAWLVPAGKPALADTMSASWRRFFAKSNTSLEVLRAASSRPGPPRSPDGTAGDRAAGGRLARGSPA